MTKSDLFRLRAEEIRTFANDVSDVTLLDQLESVARRFEALATQADAWDERMSTTLYRYG